MLSSINKFMRDRHTEHSNFEFFYGKTYSIDQARVCVRGSDHKPAYTVVCVNGFLADHRYFTQLYTDVEIELILLTNSGYHMPVAQRERDIPEWARPIHYAPNTVKYDAAALCQALEHLPTTEHVRVHGHSRGGAIVMEAARQQPELFANIEVVLEAAMLPQGKLAPALRPVANSKLIGLAPYYGPFLQMAVKRIHDYGSMVMGKVDRREREFLASMATNPHSFQVVIDNVIDLVAWADETGYEVWDNIMRGYVLLPRFDLILSQLNMHKSAQYCRNQVQYVQTEAKSHFISVENSDYVPRFIREPFPVGSATAAHL